MDRKRWQRYLELYIEKQPEDSRLTLEIDGIVTIDTSAGEFKDILMNALFTVPALRKELDKVVKELRQLIQAEDQGETLSSKPPKWEYRFLESIYKSNNERLETQLNEMGRDGWELAIVNFEHGEAIFKRLTLR